jgi:ribosomal protein S18 acetylase RimI-like enzyme
MSIMGDATRFRMATAADLNEIHRLLLAQFHEHEIELPVEQLHRAIAAMFESDGLGFFVVARRREEVVGLAAVSFAWTLEHGGKSAWLDELYVDPAHRERGIGTSLLREAIRQAEARGCAAIDLEVDHDHGRAEALYAQEGFSPLPRSRWMRLLRER